MYERNMKGRVLCVKVHRFKILSASCSRNEKPHAKPGGLSHWGCVSHYNPLLSNLCYRLGGSHSSYKLDKPQGPVYRYNWI